MIDDLLLIMFRQRKPNISSQREQIYVHREAMWIKKAEGFFAGKILLQSLGSLKYCL